MSSQINLIQKKVDKNKKSIIENNKRINYYAERGKNLDYIAKEKYGIKNYENILMKQDSLIKMNENKINLLKKIEIYEKGIDTDKIKYEREIKKNENAINILENEKIELIYKYKELIGDEAFHKIIDNFKMKNKNFDTQKSKIDESNGDKIINNNINNLSEESKENNILVLKDNIKNVSEKKDNMKNYPEFLDFFKDEEKNRNKNSEKNSEKISDNISIKGNKSEEYMEENLEESKKDEQEINIAKFEDTNNFSNNSERNKKNGTPPDKYDNLEEFQI